MYFFQLLIAEQVVSQDDFAFVARLWRDWSPGFEPSLDLLAEVRASLSAPGSLEAALGYYRALFDPARQDPSLAEIQERIGAAPIEVPTLYLHGTRDGCIGAEVLEGMEAFFPAGLQTEIVPGAGHFLHLDAPEEVQRRVVDFLKV